MPTWKPDMIGEAIIQDDLYVDMTFAQVLDDKGLDATTSKADTCSRTGSAVGSCATLVEKISRLRGSLALVCSPSISNNSREASLLAGRRRFPFRYRNKNGIVQTETHARATR